jgi:hypothetical protein
MIFSTNAYAIYKKQSEQLLDFAVFVSYSVPLLRSEIAKIKTGAVTSLPRPDFFQKSNRSTPDDLLRIEPDYENRLAAYLLLSAFSFFEAFVTAIIEELILFHGGADDFVGRVQARTRRFMAPHPPEVTKLKKKLRGAEVPRLRDKYRVFSRLLAQEGYRFPAELLAPFGLKTLIAKAKRLKAFEIPAVLNDALQLKLSPVEIQTFEAIRETRNNLAHGTPVKMTMRDAVQMATDLKKLGTKIALHLDENFFLVERYAP